MLQDPTVRGNLGSHESYHLCFQDFDTKDYVLEFEAKSITITKEQFDDGTWQEIVRREFQ